MTEQQTDLSPRELDAALAERLFGAKRVVSYDTNEGDFFCLMGQDKQGGGIIEPLVHYSTTGDGMLLVLEAMDKNEWLCRMTRGYAGDSFAVFFKDSDHPADWDLHGVNDGADTLPRAVALAALAALDREPQP